MRITKILVVLILSFQWVFSQEKSVNVTDKNNKVVGTVHPSKIINTVFGGRKNNN